MTRVRPTAFALTLVLQWLMASNSAQAAFRVVPFQFPTIQDAVDASDPGDTVWVLSGEYRENVYVDVDDLTIRGVCLGADSRAIVDGGTAGNVFDIASDAVALRCLTIRHGDTGIQADHRVDVSNVKIIGSADYGIYIDSGTNFTIQNSEVIGTSSTGIYVNNALGGTIMNTTVRGADEDCYYLDLVDGLVFANNRSLRCADYALQAYGEAMQIRDSTFQNNYGGVYVEGSDTTVTANSIIDSANGDDGLYVSGDNNTIESNIVTHCYYDCISASGDGIEIVNNEITSSTDDYCMDLDGDDLRVTGNSCLGNSYYGVYLTGANAEVRDNVIDGALNSPVYIKGSDAIVTGNTVRGSYDGLYVSGSHASVEANVVSAATFCPIYVTGDDPRVVDNQVEMGNYESILVDCGGSCSSAEVRGNQVTGGGSGSGYSGLYVDSGPGTLISDNTVRSVQGYGLEIYCDECMISSNTTIENGGYDGGSAGFYVRGDDSTLTGNVAVDNTGPGFRIVGDGNTLDSNQARRNALEGYRIELGSTGNALNQNIAEGNHAEGIDNKGTDTDLTSNVCNDNRTDCTDNGSIATQVGNVCGDGSDFTLLSEID